ncbi:MAG: hypothetical protein IKO62_07060 [Bacteroidales bacterium]|nr:hypothetical protein [Bacteroidales bacterium]
MIFCVAMLFSIIAWAQNDLRRAEGLSDRDWEIINGNPDYFKAVLAVQDSLMAGQLISVQHLQDLMPKTYEEFQIFLTMEYYAVIKTDKNIIRVEDEKAIYTIAENLAKSDILDMMRCYLKWKEWCDGWIGEVVWSATVEIENRHPEKFRQLMANSKWYEDWKDYRNEYVKEVLNPLKVGFQDQVSQNKQMNYDTRTYQLFESAYWESGTLDTNFFVLMFNYILVDLKHSEEFSESFAFHLFNLFKKYPYNIFQLQDYVSLMGKEEQEKIMNNVLSDLFFETTIRLYDSEKKVSETDFFLEFPFLNSEENAVRVRKIIEDFYEE